MNDLLTLEKIGQLALDPHKIYFLSPFGLGDTQILMGLRIPLENLFGAPIVYIIKKTHKILLSLYPDVEGVVIDEFRVPPSTLYRLPNLSEEPERGKIFLAHFSLHKIGDLLIFQQKRNKKFSLFDCYKAFFKLPWDTVLPQTNKLFEFITRYDTSTLNKKLRNKFRKNVDIGKMCLLIPETRSLGSVSKIFWDDVVKSLSAKGVFAVQSVTSKAFMIHSFPNIDLTLEELLVLSLRVSHVYTARNGLCDIIWQKGKNLTVAYPDLLSYYGNRLKSEFPSCEALEVIL